MLILSKKSIIEKFQNCNKQLVSYYLTLIPLGVVLFLQHAWVQGFFPDGMLYAAFGKNAALKGHWLIPKMSEYTFFEFTDHTPFIFILEGVFFKIFGHDFLQARLFASIFSISCLLAILFYVYMYTKSYSWTFFSGLFYLINIPLLKKSRFPGLDTPLMLFYFVSLMFYWQAIQTDKKKYWSLVGIFFGLSLLTKGPMGFFIFATIFVHLMLIKKFKKIFSFDLIMAFLIGLVIFSIWPLMLFSIGRIDIFLKYINFTLLHTALDGRGVDEFNTHFHLVYLFKFLTIQMLLILFVLYRLKTRFVKNSFLNFNLVSLFTFLVLISIPKLKYSNYLIPIYPFLAISSAFAFNQLKENYLNKINFGVRGFTAVLALTLLVFPLTTEVRRDHFVYKSFDRFKDEMGLNFSAVGVVNHSYPFFTLASLLSYQYSIETFQIDTAALAKILNDQQFNTSSPEKKLINPTIFKWAFFIRKEDFNRLDEDLKSKVNRLVSVNKNNIYIISSGDENLNYFSL